MIEKLLLGFLLISGVVVPGSVLAQEPPSEPATEETRTPQIVGSARDLKNGDLLYTEYHYCTDEYLLCSVEYRDSAGELIAHKKLDYSPGPVKPSLVMKDFRQASEISYGVTSRDDLVVDAGFDNFVRSKWEVLAKGGTVKFPFQVVGFDKPLKMLAKLDQKPTCDTQELCLEIVVDSWLLGMLADPISLSYSREERKLLRFRGRSDIRGEEGESLDVDISYQYSESVTPGAAISGPDGKQ